MYFFADMKVDSVEILFRQGDITEFDVDAVVNAANNRFYMGGGVAGAIKKKGGKEIEDEAVKKGPVNVGEAIITGAGKLKAKYVIHAAVMGTDFKTDKQKIKKATYSSLKLADERKLSSIAFPAFGTGVGRIPANESADAMLSAVVEYIKGKKVSFKKIFFVLYDEGTYNDFLSTWEQKFGKW